MALERVRKYELRERQLELGAVRFYELAHALLLNEGNEYTKTISGSYLRPVPGSGQGGPLEAECWNHDIPYLVFAARVSDESGNVSVVLASVSENRGAFHKSSRKISGDDLYGPTNRDCSRFELYVVNGEFGIEDVIGNNKPVLIFDVRHFDANENSISVYGKTLLEGVSFRQDISQKTANEFLEMVDLLNRISSVKGCYTKIEPKPEKLSVG
ncbi:hypothetical protein A3A60_00810 [Candidatus Curtissbacteria bacterium RIFCSPLOWO2_01_FULL_42_26]|uniref:Uncharacterized protein n=1 Tax=Candidatus Curtissbacteria bacterium RIFCSPLOWO2_01_FULL_42_26 TaxID=1797729 RepID=A0A1F5HXK0_9BACT|nr:MAG: hypothetical protein A3A60_00810 [Candidatus Curtissbacteria bacterium RIFCSPLOWO2_01_FULL_42_26]